MTLAQIAQAGEGADVALLLGQFLDDFAHAEDKLSLIADEPLYAFDTENPKFQSYLHATTPREYQWRNLFLGENVLARA